eukprot:UN01759
MLRTLIVLFAVCVAIVAAQSATPVLMFGSQQYFTNQQTNTNTLTATEFTAVLDAVLKAGNNPDVIQLNAQQIPTTVMVVTANNFNAQNAAKSLGLYGNAPVLANLKNKMQFYYPNTIQTNTELFYRNILPTAQREQQNFAADATCADIQTFLNNVAQQYQNTVKVNNLLIQSSVADIAVVDACLNDIMTTLDTNAQSKFLLVVQGNVENAQVVNVLTADVKDDPVVPTRADGLVGPQYVNGGTLVALFTVFVLLGFAFFGFTKMLDVEGPLRFPVASHLPPATREY